MFSTLKAGSGNCCSISIIPSCNHVIARSEVTCLPAGVAIYPIEIASHPFAMTFINSSRLNATWY